MKQFLRIACTAALLAVCSTVGFAQLPQLQWAKAITSTGSMSTLSSALDSQKNLYVAGSFSGTADFDPGAGTANLTADTAFGLGTYFLAKYDALGTLVFVRQLGGAPFSMALNSSGELFVAGDFIGTKDFDPGAGVASLTSAGISDIFVAKYSATGNYISAFRLGSTSFDVANAITTDAAGNMYVTGYFSATVDFDPGAGTTNLTSGGSGDIFLAKYSGAGALQYAFRLNASGIGSSKDDEGSAVVADNLGNVYLGGRFFGTIDLDPGTGTASFPSFGGLDGFLAKYDAGGNYIKGYTYHGNVYSLALDGMNNLYVAGTIPDTMDVDPGPGVANLYSVNNFDVWMAKYDADINYLQARAFVSNKVYTPQALAIGYNNSAYLAGRFLDTADFNPGGAGGTLISNGGLDAFLTRFDAGGNLSYATSFGSTGTDQFAGLAADKNGNLWTAGSFTGTVDLDFSTGVTNLTSPTGAGVFIGRYTEAGASVVVPVKPNQLPIGVYGADNKVIVDFTAMDKVDAEVKVLNMLGQTVAEAKHNRADMLKLALPDAAAQLYVVVVSNGGVSVAKKVWVK